MCNCTVGYRCTVHRPMTHAGRIVASATFDVPTPDAAYAVKSIACHICGAPKGVNC